LKDGHGLFQGTVLALLSDLENLNQNIQATRLRFLTR